MGLLVPVKMKKGMTMAQEVRERSTTVTDESEPDMVLFSDEEGLDLADDVELITLSSATLGAIVARRC